MPVEKLMPLVSMERFNFAPPQCFGTLSMPLRTNHTDWSGVFSTLDLIV